MSNKTERNESGSKVLAIAVLLAALLVSQSGPPRNTAIAAAVPAAPTDLAAAAVSPTHVGLAWLDNASDETGYRVERATDAAFTENRVTFLLGANMVFYGDASAAIATTYHYRVFAFNAEGDSPTSNVATASTVVPAAPTNLAAAVVSPAQVNLAWLDNADDETGYRVERATDAAFAQNLTSFRLAANVVSYRDTTAAAATIYYYRVYAFNGIGESSPSAAVSVIITAALAMPPAGEIVLNGFSSAISPTVDSNGVAQSAVQLRDASGNHILDIAPGTKLLDMLGTPLANLSHWDVDSLPAPPAQASIVDTCFPGPIGATFNPPVTLTIKYDPSTLPSSVKPGDIYMAQWDGERWQSLPSTVDTDTSSISAKVSRFTLYSVIAR